uniref:Aminoglycoside 6-adenylyltransferase n=1 Tax=Anthurium amnicola TaxID=1678845 RepID=A0A1D1ZCK4_9ARAE
MAASSPLSPLLLSPSPNLVSPRTHHHLQLPPVPAQTSFPSKPISRATTATRLFVSSPPNNPTTAATATTRPPRAAPGEETVFFDGGAHYGDLVANLLLGFTLLWLPLTIAAVSRAFFLRYRFTNLRVTVISGFTGQDRSDFSYRAVKDVQVVPRFIGEWGDIVITLKDGTKVDLRSVPKFREIADYCLYMADEGSKGDEDRRDSRPRGF